MNKLKTRMLVVVAAVVVVDDLWKATRRSFFGRFAGRFTLSLQ